MGERITHTSDYFDLIYDYAIKMIKEGKAYVDDTDREQVGLVTLQTHLYMRNTNETKQ